ncbi:15,16-dihydrobiliverdin:ferredoxin oxidoreductase [Galdieria sulphuraria]|uniref:15,16-dihydrobiliverdin:ferredoxin oxidoreductase n=1 Tax=Galdieria sulphuraria TaxID=130081 RepID=M2XA99_GALSU|nr:15,16-dihydrobiliverdin:ferredoxin oxidoreductase [Galdieria sulphuraria]EME26797.1 15,16-dihydrobiliverdin:ferredoxin oxidoreductase [Galdieria sulphuraria]GJD11280.1 15,16-dihydrobiliverdin:ferredoxin oxidoreductase [Galdieria sulphuraria]|eukprot:XP_005703317.1 15,16-dihydrobiliverdin:ferredoxin oxidoreductase [Galdieria sulphuraria]
MFVLNIFSTTHKQRGLNRASCPPLGNYSNNHTLAYRVKCISEETRDSNSLVSSLNRKLWKTSVAGSDIPMIYSPFLEDMQNTLFASFETVEDYPLSEFLASAQSSKKPARIESWCYQCPKFRKIRLTYLDAGVAAQVFNAVWYPISSLELPILGVDFLSFGGKNVLCVMDFQPLMNDQYYLDKYIQPLHPIRERYADLAGRMSSRFYDENRFFSKELLFGRFDSTKPIYERLFPAFREYLDLYITLAKQTVEDDKSRSIIWQLQCEYDRYSAEKDPAMSLFRSYFGSTWAHRFVYEFLFENSRYESSLDNKT